MEKHYVYWIHHPEHTDPYEEGYVGVSIHPEYRIKQHRRHREFWDDRVTWKILHEYDTSEESYDKEREYRPQSGIGWNIAKGGGTLNRERNTSGKRSLHSSYMALLDDIERLEQENAILRTAVAACRCAPKCISEHQ